MNKFDRKMMAAVFAGGLAMVGSQAVNAAPIALGDASFEDFAVPGTYAYSDTYRPTSAWVDDGINSGAYLVDDGNSNWLYGNPYGTGFRPTARTGDQAMHGFGYYSGQATGAVFEANTTYSFSIWAQGDNDATDVTSRVWMYIYDATVDGGPSNAGAMSFQRYAPDTGDFVNRDVLWTDQQSADGWTQITLQYTTGATGAELGNAVGVGLWLAGDGAVDDASLDATLVPEPASLALLGLGGLLMLKRKRDS